VHVPQHQVRIQQAALKIALEHHAMVQTLRSSAAETSTFFKRNILYIQNFLNNVFLFYIKKKF